MKSALFRIIFYQNDETIEWLEKLTEQLDQVFQALFALSVDFELFPLSLSDWNDNTNEELKTEEFTAEVVLISDSLFQLAQKQNDFKEYLYDEKARRFIIATEPFAQPENMNFNEREFYTFYKQQRDNKVVKFDFKDEPQMDEFWLSVIDLCYELQYVISIKSNTKRIKTVYLAEVSEDLESTRQLIKRELLRFQHRVIPHNRIYATSSNLEKKISQYCQQADLIIQLVGSQQSAYIPGTSTSLLEKQIKIASETAYERLKVDRQTHKPFRYVWMPPNLEPENENYAIFIESLKRDSELLFGAELLQNPLEVFKSIIIRYLQKDNNEINKQTAKSTVFIVSDDYTDERTRQIESAFTKKGYVCYTLEDYGYTLETLHAHRNFLVDATGVVLVFQTGNFDWLISKMKDIVKSPGFGRLSDFIFAFLFYDNEFKDALPEDIEMVFHDVVNLRQAENAINNLEIIH